MDFTPNLIDVFSTRRAKKLIELVSLLIFLLIYASADIDILYRKDVCDEKEFYTPYVRVLRTRQPYHENFPIAKLLKPGYISLTKYTGILCINGPAIVYTEVGKDPVCGGGYLPNYGEPQLFVHDCFSINRMGREAYKKSDQQEMTKDSKVFGNKVYGVYLLGQNPDYRFPNFAFYPGPNYGYNPDNSWCVHEGGSVAFVANDTDSAAHCYSVKKYNMDGMISTPYTGNPVFCYREDKDEDIDTPWHKGEPPLTTNEIVWDDENTPCTAGGKVSLGDLESEPQQLPDFRMIHPKFWSSKGSQGIMYKAKKLPGVDIDEIPVYSRPNPPGSLFPGEPGWRDPTEVGHAAPAMEDMDEEATTLEPYQKFEAEIPTADCEEIPKPQESCTQDLQEPCEWFYHVLTMKETDWKDDVMKDGAWRVPIINLINSIYEKACPQVAKFLAAALSRVYQMLLHQSLERNSTMKEKFNQPHKHEWAEMIMDLQRCEERAEPMVFFKKRNAAAVKYKNKLEAKLSQLFESVWAKRDAALKAVEDEAGGDPIDALIRSSRAIANKIDNGTSELQEIEKIQNHLSEIPLKFPYKIYVGKAGASDFAKAEQVFVYREAAEIDHEFDWGLDAYWKVIATVLGYCNMHYPSRDSAIYMRLYDSITQDFLEYIVEDWIKGTNRLIYDQIFGEFIYGPGTLWLEACFDGSYQWADVPDLRPLRPLPLNDGDVPPGPVTDNADNQPVPTNFFVDNPVYTKQTNDHFDYDGEGGDGEGGGGGGGGGETEDDTPEKYTAKAKGRPNGVKSAIFDSIVDPIHHFI